MTLFSPFFFSFGSTLSPLPTPPFLFHCSFHFACWIFHYTLILGLFLKQRLAGNKRTCLESIQRWKKEAFLTRSCIAFVHDANPYVCCEGSRTRSGASSWLHGRIPVPGVYPVTLWAWHFTNEKTLEDRSYVTLYLQSNASFLSSVTAVRTRHHLVPEFLLHFRHF